MQAEQLPCIALCPVCLARPVGINWRAAFLYEIEIILTLPVGGKML